MNFVQEDSGVLNALRALRAALPPYEFWVPDILGGAPEEVVDQLVEEIWASDLPKLRQAQALRNLNPWDRACALFDLRPLRLPRPKIGKPGMQPDDEEARRAICYAAGIPAEMVSAADPGSGRLDLFYSSVHWLPAGLAVPGDVDLTSCGQLKAIPEGFSVKGDARLVGCRAIKTIGEDLHVGGELRLGESEALESIGANARVGGSLDLGYSGIMALPAGLDVQGALILHHCDRLGQLPPRLKVGGDLNLNMSAVRELGQGIRVESGRASITQTPLLAWRDEDLKKALGFPGGSGEIDRRWPLGWT